MLTPTFTRTPHLVDLIAEAEHLAATLDLAAPATTGEQLWADAVLATLRLDGSPIPQAPTPVQVDAARAAPAELAVARRADWADVIQTASDVDTADDEVLWTREYLGAIDALSADDVADRLVRDPLGAFAELHRRLTTGLVAADQAGTLRQSDQAVHDAAVGRIVLSPVHPSAIPSDLHRLAGWLASAAAAREHGLVVSGLVHLDLLRIHPFESANGRVARTAARLLLRSRGLDPHGLALPELALAEDAIGTYDEVARTMRRRDQTIWLERWGEAVVSGLRLAARRLGMLVPTVPDRALAFVESHAAETFTVVDYRAGVNVGPEESRTDLGELLDAGLVHRVLGGRGLSFRVVRGAAAIEGNDW